MVTDTCLSRDQIKEMSVNIQNDVGTMKIINFQQAISKLEAWGMAFLMAMLQQRNIFTPEHNTYELKEIKHCLNVLPKYDRLLKSLIELLIERHWIIELELGVYRACHLPAGDRNDLENELMCLKRQYPEIASNADFLDQSLVSLFSVLSGEKNFLHVMFLSGSFKILEQIYKFDPEAHYFNKKMAYIIKHYAEKHLDEFQPPISIVELGAGVGSSSEHILPILKKLNISVDYVFTDISKAFTKNAQRQFSEKYEFMSFASLNIELPLEMQGFGEKKYDMVLATNVLHVTKNILATLKNVRLLLKPQGILILNESIMRRDYSTLTFGLTDGWWAFEDEEWRIPGSPLVSSLNWQGLLKMSGFQQIESLIQHSMADMPLFQDIITAR